MSGFYVTTSRKPSVLTRKLVRWLRLLLGGKTENRGKRSVGELVHRAKESGFSNILVIHESHGNPSQFCFLQNGEWRACINLAVPQLPEYDDSSAGRSLRKLSSARHFVKAGEKADALICGLFSAGFDEGGLEAGGRNNTAICVVVSGSGVQFTVDGKPIGPVITVRSVKELDSGLEQEAEEN